MKSTWRLYLVLKVDQKQNCLHVQESLHPKRWLNCVYSKPTRSMVLNPCLGQEGSYELGSVRPSFLWEVVLGLAHLIFLKLRIVLKAHVLLCVTARFFEEQIPCSGKIWFLKYGPKCCWTIRLQDFWIDYISRTKWQKSLIFGILIQIN